MSYMRCDRCDGPLLNAHNCPREPKPISQEQAMRQTLHAVKEVLESDSIEYDDIRNLLTMIDGVLNPVDIKMGSVYGAESSQSPIGGDEP